MSVFSVVIARAFAASIGLLLFSHQSAATGGVTGQSKRREAPSFDVASIRLIPEAQRGYLFMSPEGQPHFAARNMPLTLLVEFAYGVDAPNISGWPKHVDDSVLEIEAKPEGDAGLSYDQLKPMLRDLLEQRFGMVSHRATKTEAGYALLVARNGPKLKEVSCGQASGFMYPSKLQGKSLKATGIAGMLSTPLHKPVRDATGLSSCYDFDLNFAPENGGESTLPSLFTALREQLGLELKTQPVPVEALVIDHLDLTPTEN